MVTSAFPVFQWIPAGRIDFARLPESNDVHRAGYIVLAQRSNPGLFHIVFLNGRAVALCARWDHGCTSTLPFHEVGKALQGDGTATVSLFQADQPVVAQFIEVFRSRPCFRMRLDGTRPCQRTRLLTLSGCTSGLLSLRLDRPSALPRFTLLPFESTEHLVSHCIGHAQGWAELFEISPAVAEGTPQPAAGSPSATPSPPPGIPSSAPAFGDDGQSALVFPGDRCELERSIDEFFSAATAELATCLGDRTDELVRKAIDNGASDGTSTDGRPIPHGTAVFRTIGEIARIAPMFKRKKVKSILRPLVSDFLQRQYDALARDSVLLDEVETLYGMME